MAFSDDAIGFFLQADDQLSPVLDTAAGNYRRFVKDIETMNKGVYRDTARMTAGLAALADEFADLPKTAATAYKKLLSNISDKPIFQRVSFKIDTDTKDAIGSAIGKGIKQALASMTIRLTPDVGRKSSLFNNQSVRAIYKTMVQPPDMVGEAKIPRFAQGGIVAGPGGIDKVLAYLTAGEMVVPRDATQQIMGGFSNSMRDKGRYTAEQASFSRAVGPLVDDIRNLTEAISRGAASGGLNTAEGHSAAIAGQGIAAQKLMALQSILSAMPQALQNDMLPVMVDMEESVKKIGLHIDAATVATQSFTPAQAAAATVTATSAMNMSALATATANTTTATAASAPVVQAAAMNMSAMATSSMSAADAQTEWNNAVQQAAQAVPQLNDQLDQTPAKLDKIDNSLARLIGPVRYLAVAEAWEQITASAGETSMAMRNSFGDADGLVLGFIENINKANTVLDLSRDKLGKLKSDLAGLVMSGQNLWYTNATEIGASVSAMTEAGYRAEKQFKSLAPVIARLSNVTGLSVETIARSSFQMQRNFNATDKQIQSTFLNLRKYAKIGRASVDDLAEAMTENTSNADLFFASMSGDQAMKAQEAMNRTTAALSRAMGPDAAKELTGIMSKALGGDLDAIQTTAKLGVDFSSFKSSVAAGDTGAFERVAAQMASQARASVADALGRGDTLGAQKIAETLGLSNKVVAQSTRHFSELAEAFKLVDEQTTSLDEAGNRTTTTFDKMKNAASNVFTYFGGEYVLDFFKEFNPMAAVGAIMMVKFGVDTAMAMGKATAALLGFSAAKTAAVGANAAGGLATAAAATGTLATAGAGGVGLAATIAALGPALVSLSTGLGALGTVGLPGVLVIVGVAGAFTAFAAALAYATKWLVPFVEVVGDKLVDIIGALGDADPVRLAALGASLTVFGMAFLPMASSIALGLGVLIPAMMGLGAVQAAVGLVGGNMSIAGMMNMLGEVLGMDPSEAQQLQNRVNSTTGVLTSVAGMFLSLAKVSASFALASVVGVASAAISVMSGGMASMYFQRDQIKAMFMMAMELGGWASGFSTSKTEAGFTMLSSVMKSYGDMAEAFSTIKSTATWDAVGAAFTIMFTGQSPLVLMIAQAKNIKSILPKLVEMFATLPIDESSVALYSKNADLTSRVLEPLGHIFKTFSDMSDSVNQLREGWIFSGTFVRAQELLQAMSDPNEGLGALLRTASASAIGWARNVGGDTVKNLETTKAAIDALKNLVVCVGELGAEVTKAQGSIGSLQGTRFDKVTSAIGKAVSAVQDTITVKAQSQIDLPAAEQIDAVSTMYDKVSEDLGRIIGELVAANANLQALVAATLDQTSAPPQVMMIPNSTAAPRPSPTAGIMARGGIA